MVPVRLELQNFLSYGTHAPALDFDQFDVACLSGKNGQGKSALLDAITWSVWGEARKSSGKRKPDDELIRMGTRHMEVTFTFDVEASRYRVQRTFTRSASGKTTNSELEFQLYEPGQDGFQPLTGSHQRETQAIIEQTIGLDYDTFINSAFLLQGRSDEFTKKSPSQRKEILVNILDLSRYERLAAAARDKRREARDRAERHTAEIERLREALEEVPEWKDERATVNARIREKRERLEELRTEETRMTERLASLRAKAQEVESIQNTLSSIDERVQEHRETMGTLRDRIEEANDLIEQRDQIQRDYERYEKLQEQREDLDQKRDLHRGIEKQIEQKKSELERRRNQFEKKLHRIEVEHKSNVRTLNEIKPKLARKNDLQEKLQSVRAAEEKLEAMGEIRDRRESIRERLAAIETELVGRRQQLQGELDSLNQRMKKEERALQESEDLPDTLEAARAKLEEKQSLDQEQREVKEKGMAIRERIQEKTAALDAATKERAQVREDLDRVRSADEGTCPTCGTDLTASHAKQVEATLSNTIETLNEQISTLHEERDAAQANRQELLDRYAAIDEQLQSMDDIAEQVATLREQVRTRRSRVKSLQSDRQSAAELRRRLSEKAYGAELREEKAKLRETLNTTLSFDAEAFESLQNEAAQVDRYREQLQEIETLEGRRDELERKVRTQEKQMEEIRESLDSGDAFGTIPQTIEQLENQLEQVGFDPGRFQEVKQSLGDLKEAAGRMKDLVNAQQNREEWRSRRTRLKEQIEAEQNNRVELKQSLASLREELSGREDLETKRNEKAEEVAKAEQEVNELQKRLGMLNERLDKAKADRAALKEAQRKQRDAEKQRQLYKHLRRAFGKHGIPSLIIEETLPEIEERANLLLDRLTDGKMHVRLETLKDKKTGGTKETLEIIITDEQGMPRPYETFSGGESFRVNFALRLALAQLLAERSGVRVRTLVIDEGFGTQDAEGIERLVESIQAVREDFAKILVITHLQQLKQAFPVRIEVEKDPVTGSSFDLIGV